MTVKNIECTAAVPALRLAIGGKDLLLHTPECPAVFAGRGKEHQHVPRQFRRERPRVGALRTAPHGGGGRRANLHAPGHGRRADRAHHARGRLLRLRGECGDKSINRIWLRLRADEGEHVTGGGEQFSALDMRGRLFPDMDARAGRRQEQADRDDAPCRRERRRGRRLPHHFLPQPTFVSSSACWAHLENYEYSELDFRAADFHE